MFLYSFVLCVMSSCTPRLSVWSMVSWKKTFSKYNCREELKTNMRIVWENISERVAARLGREMSMCVARLSG